MRILFIVNGFGKEILGGACIYHSNLALKLKEAGHYVVAVSRSCQDHYVWNGISVFPLRFKYISISLADCVIATPTIAQNISHHNLITIVHSCDKLPPLKPDTKVIYCAEHLQQSSTIPNKSMVYRPMMWLDEATEPRRLTRQPVIGATAIRPSKGGAILAQVAEMMPNYKFRYINYGGEKNGRKWPENVEFVEAKYYDKQFMEDYYASIDILLMPSMTEGYCTSALEAVAKGIPCIHNHIPGINEVVGDCGFYATTPQVFMNFIDIIQEYNVYEKEVKLSDERWQEIKHLNNDEDLFNFIAK